MGKGLVIGGFLTVIGLGIGLYYWITRDLVWEKISEKEWRSQPPVYRILMSGETRYELYHPVGKKPGLMGAYETFEEAKYQANKHHLGQR